MIGCKTRRTVIAVAETVDTDTIRPLMEVSATYSCVVALVKSGSAAQLKTFNRFLTLHHCDAERLTEFDNGNAAHAMPFPDREHNRQLNANVVSEYLVWGLPSDLTAFLDANTGDGKCIRSWHESDRVHIGSSRPCEFSGIPKDVSATVAKRIREMKRSRKEREYREERERLNKIPVSNPESPYHQERADVAQKRATLALPDYFDTDADAPDPLTAEDLHAVFRVLVDWFMKHATAPTAADVMKLFGPLSMKLRSQWRNAREDMPTFAGLPLTREERQRSEAIEESIRKEATREHTGTNQNRWDYWTR